jgi:four helix bundle protein
MRHNFRQLKIWQSAIQLTLKVYLISGKLPKEELYGLKSQIQRCAVSLASNIAEGSGRTTDKDFAKFIDYALSSSYELETQLILINMIYELDTEKTINELTDFQKMTGSFKSKLKLN